MKKSTFFLSAIVILSMATGCTQVRYAKISIGAYDHGHLKNIETMKEEIISSHNEHNVLITNKNDNIYISVTTNSNVSEYFYKHDFYGGRDVEWITTSDQSIYPVDYPLYIHGNKNTIVVKVTEIGNTFKIGNYIL